MPDFPQPSQDHVDIQQGWGQVEKHAALFKPWQRISASYNEHKHKYWSQFCFERSKTDNKAHHFLVETTLPRGFRNGLPFERIPPAASQKGPRGTHALPGFKRSYFDISAIIEKKQLHRKTLFLIAKQKDSYKSHPPADQIRCHCIKDRTLSLHSIHPDPDWKGWKSKERLIKHWMYGKK